MLIRELDTAAAQIADVTLYPAFTGGTYVFEPPHPASGTWLRLGADPLPGEIAIRIPRIPRESYALRKARCRVLLEDALLSATA